MMDLRLMSGVSVLSYIHWSVGLYRLMELILKNFGKECFVESIEYLFICQQTVKIC